MGGKSGDVWDAGYRRGRYAYLHRPQEQARLDEIARLIGGLVARHGPCEVVDIGCGEGLLAPRLRSLAITRYVGVDLSRVALSRLPASPFAMTGILSALGDWDGLPAGNSPRILVASEILYYEPDGVAHLQRLARAVPSTVALVVSCVAGKPDKPNWDAASRRLWSEMDKTGWTVLARRTVREGELAWDLAAYDLAR